MLTPRGRSCGLWCASGLALSSRRIAYHGSVTIEFTRSESGSPSAKQEGARRAPSHSVFGNWHVTFYDRLGVGPENRADIVACDALPPNPDLPAVGVEEGLQPWPTLLPSPGWPAGGGV